MSGVTLSNRVDIIVVIRDRFSMFPRCLDALYAFTHVPFRAIVVAGGADRTTREHLHQLQAKRGNMSIVLVDHLLLPGEARNLALRQCNERFCTVLENDTIVHKNWLPPMIECLRDEGAAVVTPLVWWYRGLHTAGCVFEERENNNGTIKFNHRIIYTGRSPKANRLSGKSLRPH